MANSFFGFDTTLPGRGNPRAFPPPRRKDRDTFGEELGGGLEDGDEFEGSRLDELMEQKFAYGGPQDVGLEESEEDPGVSLEDDNADLNDETFGASAAPETVGTDFDFSANNELMRESVPSRPDSDRLNGQGYLDHPRAFMPYRGDQWDQSPPGEMSRRPSQLSRENLAEIWNKPHSAGSATMRRQPPPQPYDNPASGIPQRPMSLEEIEAHMLRNARTENRHLDEIEAQMMRNARAHGQMHPQGYGPPQSGVDRHMMSLAEVEAALRAQHGPIPPQHMPANVHNAIAMGGMRPASPRGPQMEQAGQMRSQSPRPQSMDQVNDGGHQYRGQRAPVQLGHFFPAQHRGQFVHQNRQGYPRNDYQQRYQNDRRGYQDRHMDNRPREERYRGIMNQYEKELIAKIQISQLVTDDPYRDDFYYKVYTSLTAANQQSSDDSSKAGLNWQQSLLMDQTRGGGANVTNRMQQQMQRLIEGRKQKPKGTSLSLEGALGKISLSSVRNPRQLLQVSGPNSTKEAKDLPAPQSARLSSKQILKRIEAVYSDVLELEVLKRKGPDEDNVEEWNFQIEQCRQKLWADLGVAEPIPLNFPHPFAAFLSFAKGKKVVPRVFRFLNRDQGLALISTLLSRLESIDVCNAASSEEVDIFMSNVVPTVVSVIMEVPLFVVNACVRILLERHNMVWLAKSKPGLAFLTMFLSRAEMLKQGGGAAQGLPPANEQELAMWTDIYNFLFASLHNNFASIFPPLGPSATAADEVYVWQFLAAMAVGATTVDHQRVLLTEVRDKVLETARRTDDAKALANVNLFLNALGLGIDAAQLATMSL
ncbi:hypothetical protein SpCBS45565_g01161 [Spizellomyces sp. 'palustris']|nr:hypothetical protein SpCBS45565_g01161 [Spizellomyces sp. 'palustris']